MAATARIRSIAEFKLLTVSAPGPQYGMIRPYVANDQSRVDDASDPIADAASIRYFYLATLGENAMQEFGADRLSAGSVFKFGYVANAVLIMPVMLLFGLIGMTGGTAVYQNGQPVYGVAALVTAFFMGLIFPAILATWLLLGTLILPFFKDRAPSLRLRGDQLPPLSADGS